MGASEKDPEIPDPQVRERAVARRYTAAYKARILEEYERLDKAGKGALLRREGLYSSLISSWRTARDHGAEQALARPVGRAEGRPAGQADRCATGGGRAAAREGDARSSRRCGLGTVSQEVMIDSRASGSSSFRKRIVRNRR